MSTGSIQRPEDAFLPMIGQHAWSVRKGYGTFLTMEFGLPHLAIREPIVASVDASSKSRQILARRRISVVGDWHFWIQYAEREINTASYSMRSQDAEFAAIEEALNELDGQILLSSEKWTVLNSIVLKFDLGASVYLWPSPELDDDQWGIYHHHGLIVSYRTDGSLVCEENSG